MGSEDTGRRPHRALTRLHAVFFANKKLALAASVLLAVLTYIATLRQNSHAYSPYVKKRYGLGAGDTHTGELRTALKRKQDGRAAVAIIRVVGLDGTQTSSKGAVQYLVQIKSHDYPIEAFRGSVCLLGGNANKGDSTPVETLKRELKEELHFPDWVDELIQESSIVDDSRLQGSNYSTLMQNSTQLEPGTVRYLGATLHSQTAEVLQKKDPYAFTCALYEVTLRPDQLPNSVIYPRGANVQEGRVTLLTEEQLIKHAKYAWGYEHTMEKYFGKTTSNKQKGTEVTNIAEDDWREMVWTPTK